MLIDKTPFVDGYDHCFVTDAAPGAMRHIASVEDVRTALRMDVLTDFPGVQLYTANFLPRQRGKGGAAYGRRSALCLETEYYPDRIHHPAFPQPVFAAGEPYRAETVYRFSTL